VKALRDLGQTMHRGKALLRWGSGIE
jgi:hypothetical protein